jgi:Ca-activated chloride channel homolog
VRELLRLLQKPETKYPKVESFRLIGYANRHLEDKDFENDEADAGEVGAGHSVTALYEVVPQNEAGAPRETEDLRYQKTSEKPEIERIPSEELAYVKLRYKQPDRDDSVLMSEAVISQNTTASADFRFASSVALFGMILREQEGVHGATFQQVIDLASSAKGPDAEGYRAEFVDVVRQLLALGQK